MVLGTGYLLFEAMKRFRFDIVRKPPSAGKQNMYLCITQDLCKGIHHQRFAYPKTWLDLLDLIAQVMSTLYTSETILPPFTSMLRISFCSQDGQVSVLFDEFNPSFWWSSSRSWMSEILFICLMYPRIICFLTHITKPFQFFIFYYFYNNFLWASNSSDFFISYSVGSGNPKYWS